MLLKSRGIVLNTLKYNDETLIAQVLTEEVGYRTFSVRISRGRKTRSAHIFFFPLSLVELTWDEKPNARKIGFAIENVKNMEIDCNNSVFIIDGNMTKLAALPRVSFEKPVIDDEAYTDTVHDMQIQIVFNIFHHATYIYRSIRGSNYSF